MWQMEKKKLLKRIKNLEIIETDNKEMQGFHLNKKYMDKLDKNWRKKIC